MKPMFFDGRGEDMTFLVIDYSEQKDRPFNVASLIALSPQLRFLLCKQFPSACGQTKVVRHRHGKGFNCCLIDDVVLRTRYPDVVDLPLGDDIADDLIGQVSNDPNLANAFNYSNADRGETAAILAAFAETAASFGLATNLEPVCGGKSQSLSQTHELILASGADVGICLDPHHLFRAGGSLADIAALPSGAIRHVQLCDGLIPQPPELAGTEAVCERLYPRDGSRPRQRITRSFFDAGLFADRDGPTRGTS